MESAETSRHVTTRVSSDHTRKILSDKCKCFLKSLAMIRRVTSRTTNSIFAPHITVIAAQKSRGRTHSVYTASNTERSGSRSSFDFDHELVTDSPGEQDGVELAGKQVWHSMASSV